MVNTKEISAMLEWVSRVDRYVQPDPLTVKAWADVLYDDMPSAWVKELLVRHYSKPETPTITPGIINEAWRNRPGATRLNDLEAGPVVPMPAWFKEQMGAILTKTKVPQ